MADRLATMVTRRKAIEQPASPRVPSVAEMPVTRAMLLGVRDELRARIDQTNARIDQTNARIDQTNARIDGLSAGMEAFKAEMRAEYHRMAVLNEEQEARNRIVLEVVQSTHERIARLEASSSELRDLIHQVIDAIAKRPL